jgi:Zn-dependent protease with chaperone function
MDSFNFSVNDEKADLASTATADGLVTKESRKRLFGIAPEAYRHPLDQQATNSMRSVPGLEQAVSKLSRFALEQAMFVEMLASAVRVTPRQCGRIHTLLEEACSILDVPLPALFLTQTPIVNAFALGREKPLMVLHTGLVEHMTEEELLGVIAHELGHIHCGHTVYLIPLLLLHALAKEGGRQLGVGELLSTPILMALLEWQRKAEYSADRAAVLVTQNPDAMFSALFKLTGGSPKIFEQMDREEYLKQAEEFDRLDDGKLNRWYKVALERGKSHPNPVIRAREILRYGESEEYRAILSGRYQKWDKNGTLASAPMHPVRCPHCGRDTDTAFTFCTNCGLTLSANTPDERMMPDA